MPLLLPFQNKELTFETFERKKPLQMPNSYFFRCFFASQAQIWREDIHHHHNLVQYLFYVLGMQKIHNNGPLVST